jgi:small subunit ribosomal protein S6
LQFSFLPLASQSVPEVVSCNCTREIVRGKEVNRLANEETNAVTEETVTGETETANAPQPEAIEPQSAEAEAAPAAEDAATAEVVEPELNTSLSAVETAPVAAERVEVEGGRNYELMFIVRTGEDPNAATERVRGQIEQTGGAVDNVRVSETRRLAYPVKKQMEGVYVVINGRFTKETAAELDRTLKLDEAVLRHMTLREDQ